ncbi:MAG: MotA/TolQ/ExbB proton channel family protein [Methanobrevibacter sp.]|jgi:biopolymer transport protein ExbB/TolQ|nr:MotA/TolQ/ExbB proton channel family protein [Candidatus Methanoflexus mossambicus]
MEILGSQILTELLHAISQSLLIPVIIFLLIFVIFALISLGGFISEYRSREKLKLEEIEKFIRTLKNTNSIDEMKTTINDFKVNEEIKSSLFKVVDNYDLDEKTREALARKIIEEEEIRMEKSVEKTDTIVRIGPTLGLMGTLIPMGPGLAALGAGNIESLAQAIIVAFDTTVAGLAAATIAYVVSKIKKRWYEEDLSNLDLLITSILEILNKKNF